MWSFQLYVHEIHPHGEPHWKKYGSFPGYPVVKTCAPMQGAGVQSLVKKLQSHTPRSIAKKKKSVLTTGTTLAVQWLRLWASTIGCTGSIPVQPKKKKKHTPRKKYDFQGWAPFYVFLLCSQLIFVYPSTEDFYRQSISLWQFLF